MNALNRTAAATAAILGAIAMTSCALQLDLGRNELARVDAILGPEWGDPVITICSDLRIHTYFIYDDHTVNHLNQHQGVVDAGTRELIETDLLAVGDVVRANTYKVDGRRQLEVLEVLENHDGPSSC